MIGLALAILAGRVSDRMGRKPVVFAIVGAGGICFFLFYGGAPAWAMPPLWVLSFFGYFSGDALIAGFALEIVPTQYRATVSGLRYLVEISAGAGAWCWRAGCIDHFHAHGPAIQACWSPFPSLWPRSCSCRSRREKLWKKWPLNRMAAWSACRRVESVV